MSEILVATPSGSFVGAALDTETTGLDSGSDHIIEIGIQLFTFSLPDAKITGLLEAHSALQEPGFSISTEIQSITGITNAMLAGQKIDWEKVDAILSQADVIVAHNAGFDRGFVDRKSRVSCEKLWACSSYQVAWRSKGFQNAKLKDLCTSLGISFHAHRAMSDVGAMLKLIGSEDVFTGKPYLAEILESARQEMVWLWIEGKTYEYRELLKTQGFRWNAQQKTWGKMVRLADQEKQVEMAKTLIPGATVCSRAVPPKDRFR